MGKRFFPFSERVPGSAHGFGRGFAHGYAAACGLLILIAGLAYLPLVPQLGYYHDDWFTVASRVSGVSLRDMHYVDRPMMGEVYEITYALLGDRPLNWHLFAFAVRCFGVMVFYGILRAVWPKQRLATFAMAALFAVYPGFLLQPNANNYQNHLIALALGMVSIALSLIAMRTANRVIKVGLLVCAALLVLVYPRIYEAMIGLEGLRWILIGCVLRREGSNRRAQIQKALLYCAPCLAAAGVFLIWRFFLFNSVRQGTDAGLLLAQYSSQPQGMAARILRETGKDYVETCRFAWTVPLYQSLVGLGPLDLVLALALALAAAGVLAGYFHWQKEEQDSGFETQGVAAGREMAIAGGLAVLVTLLPVTLSNRDVQFSYNLNRYTLQSMGGVAILVVGLVIWLLRPGRRGWAVTGLLALAVATQVSNAVYYRDFWAQQRQFWWQMAWRAPGLEPETVLSGMLPAGYRVAEDFEIWAPANLIYYPRAGMGVNDPIGVMAFLLTPETVQQIRNEERVPRNFRQISFTRRLDKTLVFSMSAPDSCVHFLDGQRIELAYNADPLVIQASKYSQIKEIKTGGDPVLPPANVFGNEPAHNWCFYYQKASLARQKGQWPEIARLGEEAGRLGLVPGDVSEWLPFYEAYYHLGSQERATALAAKIHSDGLTWDLYCSQFSGETANLDPAVAALCKKLPD